MSTFIIAKIRRWQPILQQLYGSRVGEKPVVQSVKEVGRLASRPRSFFDISTPETSSALRFVRSQVKDSLSSSLYKKAEMKLREFINIIRNLGFKNFLKSIYIAQNFFLLKNYQPK